MNSKDRFTKKRVELTISNVVLAAWSRTGAEISATANYNVAFSVLGPPIRIPNKTRPPRGKRRDRPTNPNGVEKSNFP